MQTRICHPIFPSISRINSFHGPYFFIALLILNSSILLVAWGNSGSTSTGDEEMAQGAVNPCPSNKQIRFPCWIWITCFTLWINVLWEIKFYRFLLQSLVQNHCVPFDQKKKVIAYLGCDKIIQIHIWGNRRGIIFLGTMLLVRNRLCRWLISTKKFDWSPLVRSLWSRFFYL